MAKVNKKVWILVEVGYISNGSRLTLEEIYVCQACGFRIRTVPGYSLSIAPIPKECFKCAGEEFKSSLVYHPADGTHEWV